MAPSRPKTPQEQYERARAHERGVGTKRSPAKYSRWLREAAENGHPEAQFELGSHYQDGLVDSRGRTVLRRNRRLAAKWYAAAAEAGESSAMNNLAVMLDTGDGIARDSARALALYERVYRVDPGLAAGNIATWYRDRLKHSIAVRWWKRAAAEDRGEALVDLGYVTMHGIGVRPDPIEAVGFLRKAIRSTSIDEIAREEAMYLLACAYAEGRGVPRSPKRAAALLERAAADGDYPVAEDALDALRAGTTWEPCRCRRGRIGPWPGNARCPRHRKRRTAPYLAGR